MTDKISQARQRLRNLARTQVESTRTVNFKGMEEPVEYTFVLGKLGEVAGPLFVAVQEALRVAEELREESREPVTTKVELVPGHSIPYPPESAYKDALAAAADRIEAAVFLALS